MTDALPTIFIPGVACSPELFGSQLPMAWRQGPVMVADTTRSASLDAMAASILATTPARFTLVGLSMGGYAAFEILRQAPERAARLVLIDTSARPDTEQAIGMRREFIAMAKAGRYGEVTDTTYPGLVHPSRHTDTALRGLVLRMAHEVGPEAFIRQQQAIMARPDSRPGLAAITCPTLVMVGDGDVRTPPDHAREIADGIAGSELVIIPDCGHLSTIERPEAVTDALQSWMQRTLP